MSIKIPHINDATVSDSCKAFLNGIESTIRYDNNILLIGNGFDIALGKKTTYKDFIVYLFILYLFKFVLSFKNNFDKSLLFGAVRNNLISKRPKQDNDLIQILDIAKNRVTNVSLDKICCSSCSRFSFLDLLLRVVFQSTYNKIFKDIVYYQKEKINLKINRLVCFDYWLSNFFKKLPESRDILRVADVTSDCLKEFYKDFLKATEDSKLHGWLDVENLIQYMVLNESILNEQFIVGNALKRYVSSSVFKNGLRNDISCSRGIYLTLQYFTIEFCCFVNLQNISRFDSYYYDMFNIETDLYDIDFRLPLKCNSHTKFDFENSLYKIIDFNYSNTSENTFNYNYVQHNLFDFYHVNGRSDDFTAVFGYTNLEQEKVNIEAFNFEKRTQRLIKNVQSVDYEALTSKPFNLFIFGHSCSPADKDVFEPLLTSNNLNIVVVYCYSEKDKLSIYKNLCEILGYKLMDHLTRQTEKLSKRLFWAIRK